MGEFHGLPGGKVDMLDTVPGCNLTNSLNLFWCDHTGRQAETDDTKIRVTFCDYPAFCEKILIDLLWSAWHRMSFCWL
jgi:hypothetical protein